MSFIDVSHENWIAKVKKELKLDSLESKTISLVKDVPIDPFFDRNVYQDSQGIFFSRKHNNWKIGFVYDCSIHTKEHLLYALQYGAESVLIKNIPPDADLKAWLDGVYLNMIEVHIESTASEDQIEIWRSFLEREKVQRFSFRSNNASSRQRIIKIDFDSLASTVSGIQSIVQYFSNQQEDFDILADDLMFQVDVSSRGIEYVSKIYALQKLWYLILESFGQKNIPMPKIEHIVHPDVTISEEENYIRTALQTLHAAISLPGYIYILPYNNGDENSQIRLNLNTQHLLKMESFVDKTSEVYKGSYVFEKLSDALVKAVWDKM